MSTSTTRKYNFYLLLLLLIMAPELHAQQLKNRIESTINSWHDAAAQADKDAYFSLMTADAVFVGTDAEENWKGAAFRSYATPYFDNGKAWEFKTLERHIFVANSKDLAWFDELLDTQLGICRGSGVVILDKDTWKIKHYVLSITVPNEQVQKLKELNKKHDEELLTKLKKKTLQNKK